VSSLDIYQVALRVAEILQQMGIPYEIGGSLASSVHGKPRSTLDADIVADIKPAQIEGFTKRLGSDYYADAHAIEKAVRSRRSFNIIHLPTMLKVDIFAVKDTAFARVEFTRRVQAHFPDKYGPLIWVSSPEDIVLHKLVWYKEGGEVSDRQWQDAIGVLRVAAEKIDRAYLKKWAETLGVTDLLKRALREAKRRK
jgi:hypothetical protein